jgi:predicted nucleic acid-binding Zn ribbon protein
VRRRTEAHASNHSRGGPAKPVSDLVPGVLRSLGVPSRALSRRVRDAWTRVADPAWVARTEPLRLQAGVLTVAVSSAPLREELVQFHAERLLAAVRVALPQDPVVSLRFTAGAERTR